MKRLRLTQDSGLKQSEDCSKEYQMLKLIGLIVISFFLVLTGCSGEKGGEDKADAASTANQQADEPEAVTVQHILIAYTGSVSGKKIERDKEEAARVADFVYRKALEGEDFGALVEQYTDDTAPGIYKMVNFGVPGDMGQDIYARAQMVAAFGDIGFPLAVGDIGMAAYDAKTSPFGWHIIKRIE